MLQDGIDFYKKYYLFENVILVVVGDVIGDEVKVLVEEYYGVIELFGLVDGICKWVDVLLFSEIQEIMYSDLKVCQLVWYCYFDGISQKCDCDFVLVFDVGFSVFGGGNMSLFYVVLVEDQKVVVNVGIFVWIGLYDNGLVVIYVMLSFGVLMEDLEVVVVVEVVKQFEVGFLDEDV